MSHTVNSKSSLHLENLKESTEINRQRKEENAAMIEKKRVYCLYRVSTLVRLKKMIFQLQRQCAANSRSRTIGISYVRNPKKCFGIQKICKKT
jgi:hypothetical protein